jgi:CMP-N-acetylneuraminic acid synthetase
MRTVAIIPARGGSKRILHKNIINFCGKPMIAWTIEAALDALNADVYVSTDDDAIIEASEKYGAKTIRRLSCNDDHSTVSQATLATILQLRDKGQEYDYVIQLMANCPLRDAKDIYNSFQNFIFGGYDFQLSCFKYGWMNPWWAVKLKDKYKPESISPEALKSRSQDLPELYCPTGAIWIARVSELFMSETFYGPDYTMFPIPWQHAVDIDDMEDLKMAEALKAMEGS